MAAPFFSDFGQGWLSSQLTANCTQPVVYSRQAVGSLSVAAQVGRTAFRTEDTQNGRVRLEWDDADFLIDVALLALLLGAGVPPAKGDRIAWAGRTSDVFWNKWRIHAKRVG